MTYPSPTFNGYTVEVWKWINILKKNNIHSNLAVENHIFIGNATWRSHLISLLFQLNQEVIIALLSHLIKSCRKALFSENDEGSNLKVGLSSCYWRGEGAWFRYVLFTQVPVGEILIQFVPKFYYTQYVCVLIPNGNQSLYSIKCK